MKFLLTGLVICTAVSAFAQPQTTMEARGSKRYDNYDYYSAIEHLESLPDKSVDDNRKLADSYDQVGDFEKAESYYAAVVQSSARVPIDVLNYARVLMKNEKYEEAEQQIMVYKQLNPYDTQADNFRLLIAQIQQLNRQAEFVTVVNLEVNSPEEDFAPFVLGNQLYFASSRTRRSTVKRTWNGNRLGFLDVYTSQVNGAQLVAPARFGGGFINKKYHEGPVSFAKKGTEMYLTRNAYKGKGKDGAINLQLLVATKNGDRWSKPVPLPFNSNEFSVAHAAVSEDGNTLIFASDMPGGKGGADLYVCIRSGGSGSWSVPVNLSKINTVGDEVFPFLHESGMLFFASNGRPGYGGLDIFAARWVDNEAGRVMNVGAPLNSPTDDFSVFVNTDGMTGYFASNRKNGKGDDDIYSFKMEKPITFGRVLSGVSKDREGKPMANAEVILKDEEGNEVARTKTDENGNYSLTTEKAGPMDLVFRRDNYLDLRIPVAINDTSPEIFQYNVALETDPGYTMRFTMRDRRTKSTIENVRITIIDNASGKQEIVYTDDKGTSLRPILNKKVGDKINYTVRLEKPGYITRVATYNKVIEREGMLDITEEMNLEIEKIGPGTEIAGAIDLQPIYFDYRKYDIRKDAAKELDKIVKVMNENPTMKVELGSHTDCRGSAEDNMSLSQKRAEASAKYIRSRITNPERIYGKGYGEYRILNGCICEGGTAPPYSEQEHAMNRRTEFVVVSY